MYAELGHFSLILALSMSILLAILPAVGAARGNVAWIAFARPASYGVFVFVAIAYGCLTYSFIISDFSVAYAANNSNTKLPLIYKISGVWGAHEGSLLLWCLILSVWTVAVALFSRRVPEQVLARVLAVMGMVTVGFLLFTLLTSNPFERMLNPPIEGRDLNPLLQDPGLAIHPPMLYMGYVGFSVAFAFAIAAMLGGRLDAAWARWMRPWTTMAWVFLTIGIALGSWWAYYELGWGGWWFWDPVENASFMPWLVGTALMHSLAVTEKRGSFKAWTVFLAILAFSLSLLGMFLVRSGVLTSVHAFATDPERGVFILAFLVIVIGGSLTLYAWRAPQIKSTGSFDLVSREAALLLNNVLLVVVSFTILLGTLYPLIMDALGLGKISVGPPYFNAVFIPITAPLAVIVGIGAIAKWKGDSFFAVLSRLRWALIGSVVLSGVTAVLLPEFSAVALLGLLLAFWVTFSTLWGVWERIERKSNKVAALFSIPRAFWGMTFGHIGIAVFIVGVTLTSLYSTEKDIALKAGDTYEAGGYLFNFEGVDQTPGPNYTALKGSVRVELDGEEIAHLEPEKRIYLVQTMPMTEAAIDAGLFRDLYVALGDSVGGGAWAVRIYHKPFIRWIWLGAIFMSIGGLLGASDKRYRTVARKQRVASGIVNGAGEAA